MRVLLVKRIGLGLFPRSETIKGVRSAITGALGRLWTIMTRLGLDKGPEDRSMATWMCGGDESVGRP